MSGEEEDLSEIRDSWLFPIEIFPRLMGKAMHTLNLTPEEEESAKDKKPSKKSSKFLPAQCASK